MKVLAVVLAIFSAHVRAAEQPGSDDYHRVVDEAYRALAPFRSRVLISSPSQDENRRSYIRIDQRYDGERVDILDEAVDIDGKNEIKVESRNIWANDIRLSHSIVRALQSSPASVVASTDPENAKRLLYGAGTAGFINGYLNGQSFGEIIRTASRVSIGEKDSPINGRLATPVNLKLKGGDGTLWIDRQTGFVVRAQLNLKDKDAYYGTPLRYKWVRVELDGVVLKKVHERWVPTEGTITESFPGDIVISRLALRESIEFNPDFDAIGAFVINEIPDGTRVFLEEEPGVRYIWKEGQIQVDVDREAVQEFDDAVERVTPAETSRQLSARTRASVSNGTTVAELPAAKHSTPLWLWVAAIGLPALGLALIYAGKRFHRR